MDKVFCEGDLTPIRQKEFNEFIKGKGFKGRNNYKLRDLKAMFGFKSMVTGSPVTIFSDGTEPTKFDSMSKASTSMEYHMLPFYMLRRIPGIKFALMEKIYNNLSLVKMPYSNFKRKVTDNGAGVGRCPCGQTFECASK